jgi:oligopeptide/dipeptide ABC transporter ATP-binding protein
VTANGALLEVEHLRKFFPIRRGVFSRVVGHVKAVDNVSFRVGRGETLGLVGESGCGKTTVGRSILRLIEPSAGRVAFDGRDLLALKGAELRRMRRRMQIIFQDPYSSLNPRMTVLDIVGEALAVHGLAKGEAREKRVKELLERVGLAARYVNRYPHEFSGGQRQRIGVARALALNPDFIVCDEAVSALDVSVQAQVINLLMDLRAELGLAYLFIAHDLSVVRHISHRIAVMYLGEIVETARSDDLFARPLHPYTQALLSAVPVPDPTHKRTRIVLEGDVPTPINPPKGCHFHPRCRYAEEICKREAPGVTDAGEGHTFRCHVAAREFPAAATTPVTDPNPLP